MTTKTKTPNLSSEDRLKAAAIMHAIEIKSSFELYAYRIISHEQFISRTSELVEIFTKTKIDD